MMFRHNKRPLEAGLPAKAATFPLRPSQDNNENCLINRSACDVICMTGIHGFTHGGEEGQHVMSSTFNAWRRTTRGIQGYMIGLIVIRVLSEDRLQRQLSHLLHSIIAWMGRNRGVEHVRYTLLPQLRYHQ